MNSPEPNSLAVPKPGWIGTAGYLLMVLGTIGLFFVIRPIGEGLPAADPPVSTSKTATPGIGQVNVVFHVLATLLVVVCLGNLLGRLLSFVGQPPVIGEVLAGILLGPSLLGAISPDAMHWLIPDSSADPKGQVLAALKAVSQIGVVLYMFLVGLHLNAARMREQAHATLVITHAGIAVPFALGILLSLVLYSNFSHRGISFTSFALFLGSALAVTAFPVLARILSDQKLEKTELGITALGCAATDDVTAWCLVALVVGVAQANTESALIAGLGAVVFIATIFLLVRPLVTRIVHHFDREKLPTLAVPSVLAAVLLSALITEAIGIHAVFGAFLLGVVIPHDSRLAQEFETRFKDLVTVLLMPAFFAVTGMRTEIGLLNSWHDWLFCALIVLVATVGKFGGITIASRLTGYSWRTAAALGALMNTRGLIALIVLEIGLNLGLISPRLYAMMVIMALVTTLSTTPALRWLMKTPKRQVEAS